MGISMASLPSDLLAPALEAVLNISPAAILMVDELQQILLFSQGAETIFGFSREEVLGKPLDILLPSATVEIHRQHVLSFAQAPESVRLMNVRQAVWGCRKDGQIFPAEAAISKSSQGGTTFFTVFLRDISARVQLEETLRESQRSFNALRNRQGAAEHLTESILLMEVEACLRSTEVWAQQLEDLTRANTELSQFATVLSHDLQEPLRAITGFLGLLQGAWDTENRASGQKYLELAQDGATRLSRLIQHLLSSARENFYPKQYPPISFEEVLNEALQNLRFAIEENAVKITYESLPILPADKGQMIQLFQNLIGNAIKFRSEQPPLIHLSVQYFHSVTSSPTLVSGHTVSPDRWVFCIQDNGIGIALQDYDRIFEIHQRLHADMIPGHGMGLTIARRVVEHHGGRIWVESEVGRGTKFYFTLPVSNSISKPTPVESQI